MDLREQVGQLDTQEALDLVAEVFAPIILLACHTNYLTADGRIRCESFFAANDGPKGTTIEEDAFKAALLLTAMDDFVAHIAKRFGKEPQVVWEQVRAQKANSRPAGPQDYGSR